MIVIGFAGDWIGKWKQGRIVTTRLRKMRQEREESEVVRATEVANGYDER